MALTCRSPHTHPRLRIHLHAAHRADTSVLDPSIHHLLDADVDDGGNTLSRPALRAAAAKSPHPATLSPAAAAAARRKPPVLPATRAVTAAAARALRGSSRRSSVDAAAAAAGAGASSPAVYPIAGVAAMASGSPGSTADGFSPDGGSVEGAAAGLESAGETVEGTRLAKRYCPSVESAGSWDIWEIP